MGTLVLSLRRCFLVTDEGEVALVCLPDDASVSQRRTIFAAGPDVRIIRDDVVGQMLEAAFAQVKQTLRDETDIPRPEIEALCEQWAAYSEGLAILRREEVTPAQIYAVFQDPILIELLQTYSPKQHRAACECAAN